MRWAFLVAGFGVMGSAITATGAGPETARRPNIVVILADDMGYSDIGCYGGEIETPNLDALAKKGVRFSQFYNNARCCPTRASLMTGLYPHQAGVGHMMEDRGYDGYRGVLNRNSATIAEVLRPAGYRTYMTGKWHLTRFGGLNGDRSTWPLGRGFDKYYGTIAGAANYFDPAQLCRQEKLVTIANDPDYRPESYYFTDAISDNAVGFLKSHRAESPDKPFFLYVAYTAAHWPMQAPESAIAKYRGKFDDGYGPHRAARLERMKALGLVDPNSGLSPATNSWDDVANKAWESRCMETFAAMVDVMDQGIGRIVDQLRADGQLDDTLILFMQDNGACAETVGRRDVHENPGNLKPLGPDQLQPRSQPPMQTRDGRWVRTGPNVMPGPADTYLAYGKGWANASNTPFREFKHWTEEGGISTPLVAHWPNGIDPGRSGKIDPQPTHLIDVMATCVDLGRASYPTAIDGKPIKPMEGISLRPALIGQAIDRKTPLFWEHEGNRAVRDGKWKLVAKSGESWSLYDIDADRVEAHDLSGEQSGRVAAMAKQWDEYAARCNVLPLGAWEDRSASRAEARLNPSTHFELKAGDRRKGAEAPAIVGRPFAIRAEVEVDADKPLEGVIVAQGGAASGYSLFLRDGKAHFVVRSGGETYRVDGGQPGSGRVTIEAKVSAAGKMSLAVGDGAKPVEGSGKLLSKMPVDGLEVGRDDNGAVGGYTAPFAYPGEIRSVVIDLGSKASKPED